MKKKKKLKTRARAHSRVSTMKNEKLAHARRRLRRRRGRTHTRVPLTVLAYAHAPRHDCCLGVDDGRTDTGAHTHHARRTLHAQGTYGAGGGAARARRAQTAALARRRRRPSQLRAVVGRSARGVGFRAFILFVVRFYRTRAVPVIYDCRVFVFFFTFSPSCAHRTWVRFFHRHRFRSRAGDRFVVVVVVAFVPRPVGAAPRRGGRGNRDDDDHHHLRRTRHPPTGYPPAVNVGVAAVSRRRPRAAVAFAVPSSAADADANQLARTHARTRTSGAFVAAVMQCRKYSRLRCARTTAPQPSDVCPFCVPAPNRRVTDSTVLFFSIFYSSFFSLHHFRFNYYCF